MKKAVEAQEPSSNQSPSTCYVPPFSHILPDTCHLSPAVGKGEPGATVRGHSHLQPFQDKQRKVHSALEHDLETGVEGSRAHASHSGEEYGELWTNSAYSLRIMRLFSTSTKNAGDGSCSKPPLRGSSAWPALSGLRVMGSFRKLRSSVLQGIQRRGDAAADPLDQKVTCSQNRANERPVLFNGTAADEQANQYSYEMSETEGDEEEEEEHVLQRNSRCSRSLRMAYGPGRLPLLSTEQGRQQTETQGTGTHESRLQRGALALTHETTALPSQQERVKSGKVHHVLSRSTDSLHVFRSPFRRRAASSHPETLEDGEFQNIQRTTSASSVELGESNPTQWKSQVLKLVSSMTDLSGRRRASPPCQGTLTPLSRLHDAYSRRVPCVPESERLRRPSSAQNLQVSLAPTEGAVPLKDTSPTPSPQVTVTCASVHGTGHGPQGRWSSLSEDTLEGPGCVSTGQHEEPEPAEHLGEQQSLSHGEFQEDMNTSGWPSGVPGTLSAPTSNIFELNTESSDTTVCSIDVARRKMGVAKPRPLSDYGQMMDRKFSIPEEEVASQVKISSLGQEDYNSCGSCLNSPGHDSCKKTENDCSTTEGSYNSNGGHCYKSDKNNRWRKRPISVIGGVDLYSTNVDEREDVLPTLEPRPPMPIRQVAPYRGVSARLRPGHLSQSTPTGLDRLGHRHLLRAHSAGAGVEGSVTLEESLSEEDCSFDDLTDFKLSLQTGVELSTLNEWIRSGHTVHAEALWDHVTMEERELAFKAGDVIRVLDASDEDWWWGMVAEREAWFPSSFVRVLVNQDAQVDIMENTQAEDNPLARDTGVRSSEVKAEMRANVVKEIMSTERIYLKHLKDICEGYIRQCRKHAAMFSSQQLATIFSNIEDIYKFHRKFLKDLERKYNKTEPHLSEIGSCFLLQGEGFSIYSEYCNNHPRATAELHRLMKLGRYRHFFEACRLLQQMIDISLAGFLLTPVQKICKYPLQLGELLKYTPQEHRDYKSVTDALAAMKKVACLINERKRRLESIDAIAHWQVAILHWEGDDVLGRSSELIHSGELTRVYRYGKTQQRTFFLFDHQLVFCKKDLLRRDLLHYRGRLDMDHMELEDLSDGRDTELGTSLKHAFRLRHRTTGESYVLCSRKPEDKRRWFDALARERQRVQEDQEMGMEISEYQRKQAILNAKKLKRGNMNSISYGSSALPSPYQPLHPLHQRHVTVPTSVPQQRVFSLAEPRRKSFQLWHSLANHSRLKK